MEIDAVKNSTYQGRDNAGITKTAEQSKASAEKITIEPSKGQNAKAMEENMSNMAAAKDVKAKDLKKSVEEINTRLGSNTECIFGFHDETNRVTIKIVDRETKELVKEIPPEKTLEMIAKIWECAGLLVDEKL